MRLAGDAAPAFARERIGTILWVGDSPFRPGHRHRNRFVSVAPAPEPEAIPLHGDKPLIHEFKFGGPGR